MKATSASLALNTPASRDQLQRAFDELIQRGGLQETLDHVAELTRRVVTGQSALRAEERAQALQMPAGYVNYGADFSAARTHADGARAAFRNELEGDSWKEILSKVDVTGSEFRESTKVMRELWSDGLRRNDALSADDARETMGIYDSVVDTIQTQGVEGLKSLFDKQLSEFEQILTPERDFGREPHSPLQWWQWLIIIAILAITVAVLIVCFVWFGCAWIYAIYVSLSGVIIFF